MTLDKNDLQAIEKIVSKIDKKIDKVEEKLTNKIDAVEEKIISTLSREVSDLADINRAVITRTDQIDYRLRIVERKLGIVSH